MGQQLAQVQKSKEAKMKAAMAGGKSRKKKWAKGKAPDSGTGFSKTLGALPKEIVAKRRADRRLKESGYKTFRYSSIISYQWSMTMVYQSSGCLLIHIYVYIYIYNVYIYINIHI